MGIDEDRKKRRANLDRKIEEARSAGGGTTGGSRTTPSGGAAGGGGTRMPAPSGGSQPTTITDKLRQDAKRAVGTIRRVERTAEGKVRFVGVSGKTFTPSLQRLARTGSISRQELTRRLGSGSPEAIRKQVVVLQKRGQLIERTIEQKTPVLARLTIRRQEQNIQAVKKKVIKSRLPISKKQKEIKKLEKLVSGIKELEAGAAKRSKQAAEVFRAVPGLRGDNFLQQTTRALLALPTRATIGVGEQVLIGGFKLAANLRGLQVNPEGTKEESGRAFKQVPITIAKGYDPRTPEGLANIVGTIVAFKLAKGKSATKAKVKTAAKSTIKKTLAKASKTKGAKRVGLKQVAKNIKSLAKKETWINKARRTANTVTRKLKSIKQKRASKTNVQREIVRKLDAGKLSLKNLKLLKRKALAEIRKSVPRGKAKTKILKDTGRTLNRKIKSLTEGIKKLKVRAKNISPLKMARLRKGIKKLKKEVSPESRISAAIQKRLRKVSKRPRKGRPTSRKKLRKFERKQLIRKGGLTKEKQSIARLLRNAEKFSEGLKRIKRNKELLVTKFKQGKLTRQQLLAKRKQIVKDPFGSKVRLRDLRRLADAERKVSASQKQLQSAGQKTIQVLEKPIARIKTVVNKAKRITVNNAKKLTSKLSNMKKILVKNKSFSRNMGLSKTVTRIAAQIIIINAIIPKIKSKVRGGQVVGLVTKPKPITKPKKAVVQKQEQEVKTVIIDDSRIDNITNVKQIQLITQILGSLAVASAFRLRGRRVLKSQTRLRGGIRKLRKFIFNKLQKKRKAFTPDIYSLIFGIKARPGEKIKLLRKGRVFTGLERRAQVR